MTLISHKLCSKNIVLILRYNHTKLQKSMCNNLIIEVYHIILHCMLTHCYLEYNMCI